MTPGQGRPEDALPTIFNVQQEEGFVHKKQKEKHTDTRHHLTILLPFSSRV